MTTDAVATRRVGRKAVEEVAADCVEGVPQLIGVIAALVQCALEQGGAGLVVREEVVDVVLEDAVRVQELSGLGMGEVGIGSVLSALVGSWGGC